MTKTIKVLKVYSDGGDGGGGITLYNNKEELMLAEDITEEEFTQASEDPEYDYEIEEDSFEVEVDEAGNISLPKNGIYFHYGQ